MEKPGSRFRAHSLRRQVVTITAAAVLLVMAVSTWLTIRLSRAALEDDIRANGLTLARELATFAGGVRARTERDALQGEVAGLFSRGGTVRSAAVYRLEGAGLVAVAQGGLSGTPGPEETAVLARGDERSFVQELAGIRALRLIVPVREGGQAVGVVSLGVDLQRADALARRIVRQALGLAVATILLLVTVLALFLNVGLTAPVRDLAAIMRRAETGDLGARAAEERTDEVGDLARGLNRMLERVGSFRSELERQVAAATAELRAVNQRLSTARQEIGRTERLAAMGELAAAMAHDVGTPLTAVSGHLQLLAEEATDAGVRNRVRTIQAQVERAVAAARRFLDSARPALKREQVDLNAVLADLLLLVAPEAERKGVQVTRDAVTDLPAVHVDPGQMQELFLNLVTNAVDATPAGGCVVLRATRSEGLDQGSGVRVSVRDTGAGMTPEVLARVFEPFYTTRAASGGTGLGLAICHRIVEQHGGRIRLKSQVGRGTEAIVELPEKGRP